MWKQLMMRPVLGLALLCLRGLSQEADPTAMLGAAGDIKSAIEQNSLTIAAEKAERLDDAVQARYRAWLVRDAAERVRDVLAWLPPDTEAFWVDQRAFVVDGRGLAEALSKDFTKAYCVDRIAVLSDGRFLHILDKQTVRLVMAATRGLAALPEDRSVPSVMTADQDVVYFYFLAKPVDAPPPDEMLEGRPAWRGTARVRSGFRTTDPAHEDVNWFVLARPDLLVLINRKALAGELLGRMSRPASNRALKADLPEWRFVDPASPMWGLRHYSPRSKPAQGQHGCEAARLPEPNCEAIGMTFQFGGPAGLRITYLSDAKPQGLSEGMMPFTLHLVRPGVWEIDPKSQQEGQFPLDFAMSMLGFGMYQ